MTPYSVIRDCWYVAGLSADFPTEKLTGHVVAKRPMVVWRGRDGAMVAYDDRCAHKRFPLSKGRLMPDGTLECAYHGLRYDCGGKCVAIPSHPNGPIPAQARLRPFPVKEQDGLVWVWPGDPAKAETRHPPRLPEVGDDAWDSVVVGPMEVPANYLLLIENLLDITHFYPLHDGNIGDIENSRIPIEYEEGEADGYRYVKTARRVTNYRQPPYLADWFVYDVVDRDHTHCLMSPAQTRVVMRVAPPGELGSEKERGYVLLHLHTPIDEKSHVWRLIINCRKEHMSRGNPNMSAAQRVASMFPKVLEEDRWALERQQEMFEFPDEGYQEVFLKPDRALRRARLIFTQMLREERGEPKRAPSAPKASGRAAP
jgi:vanillate O-demethylase monooxygenase subunit